MPHKHTQIEPPIIELECIKQNSEPGQVDQPFFELTQEVFVVPAVNSSTTIKVVDSSKYAIGLSVFILGAGHFEITGLPSEGQLFVRNNGSDGNNPPGTTVIPAVPMILETPVSVPITGAVLQLYAETTATFNTPAGASPVDISLDDVTWAALGLEVFVDDTGWYEITAIDTSTKKITVINADVQNRGPGQTVPTTTIVYPMPAPTFVLNTARLERVDGTGFFDSSIKVLETVPLTPALSDAIILTGKETGVVLGGNAQDEQVVAAVSLSFTGGPFAGAPIILLTINKQTDIGGTADAMFVYVRAETATQFDIFASNTISGGATIDVNWMAIGV